jgi:hypothetical protein
MTQRLKKTSSPTKSSKKNSTNSSPLVKRELKVSGHSLVFHQEAISKRSETVTMTAEEFGKLNDMAKAEIIHVEDVVPPPFAEAVPTPTDNAEASAKRQHEWEVAKAEYERKIAAEPAKKKVNLWLPVNHTHKVMMDDRELMIFHTLRGPLMGAVLWEDMYKVGLYSPCFIDPNIERGRVHYLPIAFAGYVFTLYRATCMGEAVPQEAEAYGYPMFVERNRAGDYRFVQRAAYHHIEADVPEDARLISAEVGVREASLGLVPTSDTREGRQVEVARRVEAMRTATSQDADKAPEDDGPVTN